MTRLREAFIDMVTAAIIRAFVWLLRAEELPPAKAEEIPVYLTDEVLHPWRYRPQPKPARRCNEFQLLVLFRVDGTLAYALGTSPEPGHRIDTAFLN